MMTIHIAHCRLHSQQLTQQAFREPHEVVSWFGAMQGQNEAAAHRAIGMRLPHADAATITQAIADRTIIRTWALRGTLHILAARDIRWVLALIAPGMRNRYASYHRRLELDETVFAQARRVVTAALRDGRLTRKELFAALEEHGISTRDLRGTFLLYRLALDGITCHATRDGKQETFTLLDEWAPGTVTLEREEALAELALRYFASHGPATVQDFRWWSGLSAADVQSALDAARPSLRREHIGGRDYWLHRDALLPEGPAQGVWLLPDFDEYLVGYKDRSAALRPEDQRRTNSGNGILYPVLVVDGCVEGTWKRTARPKEVTVAVTAFRPQSKIREQDVRQAAGEYARFLGLELSEATTFEVV